MTTTRWTESKKEGRKDESGEKVKDWLLKKKSGADILQAGGGNLARLTKLMAEGFSQPPKIVCILSCSLRLKKVNA